MVYLLNCGLPSWVQSLINIIASCYGFCALKWNCIDKTNRARERFCKREGGNVYTYIYLIFKMPFLYVCVGWVDTTG